MKTILVPTDFSPAATNAVRYGYMLAEHLQAPLKLCHIIDPLAYRLLPEQENHPEDISPGLWQQAERELQFLESSLPRWNAKNHPPDLTSMIRVGTISDEVADMVSSEKAGLVVSGVSGAGYFKKLLFGSAVNRMIALAAFPLLIVPETFNVKPIAKIAFATDLSENDIGQLANLAEFARYFNAEILITHVTDASDQRAKEINLFLDEITDKLCYNKIYYRCVINESIDDGLKWLEGHGQVDLLVLVHRKTSWLHASHCRRISLHLEVPLLVLPEALTTLYV